MTTIEQLRAIVNDLKPKVLELNKASLDLNGFIQRIDLMISENNDFSSTIDIDALITQYSPIYITKLTRIETAADSLSTDGLN